MMILDAPGVLMSYDTNFSDVFVETTVSQTNDLVTV